METQSVPHEAALSFVGTLQMQICSMKHLHLRNAAQECWTYEFHVAIYLRQIHSWSKSSTHIHLAAGRITFV